jgi:uncharacterized protein (DUF362 family)
MQYKVALVHSTDREKGAIKAINLLETNPVRGKAVVLKPNFNTADPFPASTHNDTLRTFVTLLKEMNPQSILLAERSGMGNSLEVLKQKGAISMGKELGFKVISLDDVDAEDWIQVKPKNSHWSDGFYFSKAYSEAECVVQTCCLKTHRFGGHFTLSLKNSVGMVKRSNMKELHSSPHQRQLIAEINLAYSPCLILLDGIEAFVTGGPEQGQRVATSVMLASQDRVAIDAVAVAVLRLHGTTPEVSQGHIFTQDQIARAVELNLGAHSAQEIELITGDKKSRELAKELQPLLFE